jgi:deoxycytidine triphosphate deaminase
VTGNLTHDFACFGQTDRSRPEGSYANEGIAQIVSFEADEECLVSYADKKGKYQAQREITLPRI